MWFLGLLLLAAAAGLLWGHRAQQRKHGLIAATDVQTVEHLRQLAASMAEGLGAGSLRFFAAVEGKVRCSEPLVSELAEVPSVHFSMDVRREAEERHEERSSGGRGASQSQLRASEQVAHKRHSVAFEVADATGSLRVDPAGARFHTQKSLSRFEPAGVDTRRLRVGSLELELPARGGGDSQTLGYRFEEEVVPVGAEVFVLGRVTDPGGELRIGSPEEKGKFVISVKSRAELLQELGSGSKVLRGAAIVFGVAGLLLLLFG